MLWAKQQTAQRNIPIRALLTDLRTKIDAYVLSNERYD